MAKLIIAYHGTNTQNAAEIRQNGFKKGTYFALHLEDALAFGGNHIFRVVFPKKWVKNVYWQFVDFEGVSPDKIVEYDVYQDPEIMFRDESLEDKVFLSNLPAQERSRLLAQMKEFGVSTFRDLDERILSKREADGSA